MLPKNLIPKISKSLDLNFKEVQCFETLVDFEKAKTNVEKQHYYERLNRLCPQRRPLKACELENYKYFENPLHSIVRTMIDLKDFDHYGRV